MFTKYLTVILIILLMIVQSTTVFAQTRTAEEVENQAKLQAKISKIGVGKDSGIIVKLKDGTKLNGYVSARDDNGFDLTDKSSVVKNIKYSEVAGVQDKKLPRSLTTALGVGLGIAAAIGLILLICGKSKCQE